jgi:hypothetical protein
MTSAERHAVYFAPAHGSPWWHFGAQWLGRADDQPHPTALASADEAVTAPARRYGFHATLKAPMRLREGASPAQLLIALQAVAARCVPVCLAPLKLVWRHGFVALEPAALTAEAQHQLAQIEAACVMELDGFRAPLSDSELARRQAAAPLDATAQALLQRWGYPQVLERFRFHLTLTAPVDEPVAQAVMAELAPQVQALNAASPLWLDRLCLFVEPAPGAALLRSAEVVLPAPR